MLSLLVHANNSQTNHLMLLQKECIACKTIGDLRHIVSLCTLPVTSELSTVGNVSPGVLYKPLELEQAWF